MIFLAADISVTQLKEDLKSIVKSVVAEEIESITASVAEEIGSITASMAAEIEPIKKYLKHSLSTILDPSENIHSEVTFSNSEGFQIAY